MTESLPDELKIGDLEPVCWVEVPEMHRQSKRTLYFDVSKGRKDPPFRHLVIAPDRYEGFDEHYLLCYFDEEGNWVTQSPFDTLEEAIQHGRFAFEIEEKDWNWIGNQEREEV